MVKMICIEIYSFCVIQITAWLFKIMYQYIICDALQHNRGQVSHWVYFEIWTIEVGTGVKNNSSGDFEIISYMFSITLHVISDLLSNIHTPPPPIVCIFCSLTNPKLHKLSDRYLKK